MSLKQLREHIKKREISNIYLFYGPEEYLIKHYIKSIEEIVVDENTKGFNRMLISEKIDADKMISFCETYPVFAHRKLLIVESSGFFKSKDLTEDLENFFKSIPEYMCIIFIEQEIDKRLKIYKFFDDHGLVVQFPWQSHADLTKWVVNIMRSKGKKIDNKTASYLIDINDLGMTGIHTEIDKIIAFVQDEDLVTIDDIKKVGSVTIKSVIFNLTDALVKKDLKTSLKILDDILVLREPIPKIIVMIGWQLRQIYLVKLFAESGESLKTAGTALHLHPFVLSKIKDFLPLYTIEQLEQSILSVYECDKRIKTGKMKDQRIALELLLEKLTSI